MGKTKLTLSTQKYKFLIAIYVEDVFPLSVWSHRRLLISNHERSCFFFFFLFFAFYFCASVWQQWSNPVCKVEFDHKRRLIDKCRARKPTSRGVEKKKIIFFHYSDFWLPDNIDNIDLLVPIIFFLKQKCFT